jgi:hypothetical protein
VADDGEVPPNVDPLDQERVELREETGVIASRLEHLGRFAAWPARVRRWTTVVLATGVDLGQLSASGQHKDESIEDVVDDIVTTAGHGRRRGADRRTTLCAMNLFWSRLDLQER